MGEFASNAKANTGVALGATGLGIAVANALGGCCNNGFGGLFNGLFGNRCCNNNAEALALNALAQKDAEIAMLKSENYSDKIGKEVYAQGLSDNRRLRDEMYAFIKPLAEEAANNRVNIARLEEQQKCCCEKQELREQILAGKINEVALATNGRINTMEAQYNGRMDTMTAQINGRFNALDQTIACISGKVDAITTTNVCACKINPVPMPLANSFTAPAAGTTFYPGCVSVGTAAAGGAA